MDSLNESKSEDDGLNESFGFLNVSSWWPLITASSDPSAGTPLVNILGKQFLTETSSEPEIFKMIHLTYRYGFDPISRAQDGPSPLLFLPSLLSNKATMINSFKNLSSAVDSENFTTDVGWGCMIRTSQTLLANAYLRLSTSSTTNTRQVIEMFLDHPEAPYSIHNMVSAASTLPLKVKPGEWFGPAAASLSLQRLSEKVRSYREVGVPNLRIIVGENGDVYDDVINNEFSLVDSPDGVLLLLPVRLGIEKINPYYKSSLSHLVSLAQSAGIAGGKPSSSFYFIGSCGSDMLYLNPHSPQPYLAQLVEETYHTKGYLKLAFENVDPSMLVGVTFCSKQDYQEFKVHCQKTENKIVHFHPSKAKCRLGLSYEDLFQSSEVSLNHDQEDDFVCISAQEPDEQVVAEGFVDLTLESPSPSTAHDSSDSGNVLETSTSSTSASYDLIQEPRGP